MAVMPDLLRPTPTPSSDSAVVSLQALGIDPERIELIPVGPLEKYKGGVVGQVPEPGTKLDEHSTITLFVPRDGIAERLPHDFLAPLPTAKNEAAIALEPGQTLDYWERQVLAYDTGRKLINVIDKAMGRLDRDMGRLLWGFTDLGTDDTFARKALDFVGLGELPLEDQEARYLASTLQRLDLWRGTSGGVETLLKQFLGIEVTLEEQEGDELEIPEQVRSPLGGAKARLGGGIALGPRFRDETPVVLAKLGPVGLARHAALDRDKQWHRKVEALLDMTSPASTHHRYVLELRESDRCLALGDPLRARLGRSSYLS